MVDAQCKSGNNRLKTNPVNTDTPTVEEDRLSALPDCLLVSVLSLLPTETSVSTSVLSHRWQHLWTQLYQLSFTRPRRPWPIPEDLFKVDTFLSGVDHVLRHLISPKIVKLELDIGLRWISKCASVRCNSLVNSWIRQACARNVEDISITIPQTNSWHLCELPLACIFQCDNIVSLSLGESLDYDFSDILKLNLPNLKKPILKLYPSKSSPINFLTRLFKSCPLLEEMCLKFCFEEDEHVVEIICPNLKIFDLDATLLTTAALQCVIDAPKLENLSVRCPNESFVIDAPKLKNLYIRSDRAWYCFVNRPRELAQATFGMRDEDEIWNVEELDGIDNNVSEALKAIYSVRSLYMYGYTLFSMRGLENGCLEVFHNLTELRIKDFRFETLGCLLAFLTYCPNLEVLVLSTGYSTRDDDNEFWEVPKFEPACLFTKLRVLEVKRFPDTSYHLQFIEYILHIGNVLEQVSIRARSYYSKAKEFEVRPEAKVKEFEVCRKLFSCPRNSSDCEIKFCGQ